MARSPKRSPWARPATARPGPRPLVPPALGCRPLVLDGGGFLVTGVCGRPWDDGDQGRVRHGPAGEQPRPSPHRRRGGSRVVWPRRRHRPLGRRGRSGARQALPDVLAVPRAGPRGSCRRRRGGLRRQESGRSATPPDWNQTRPRADTVISLGSRHGDDGSREHAAALSLRPPILTPCQDLGQHRRRAHDRGHVLEPGLPRRALPERRRGGDLARCLARPVDTVVVRHMAPAEEPK